MRSASGARRFTRDDIWPAVLALVALVLGVSIFAYFLLPYPVQVGYDEGYEAAAVERVIDGRGLPYVDAVSIRGPFLYWSLAIVHLVFGRFDWAGTRIIGLLSCAVTVAGLFFMGWAARRPLAGSIAAAIYVYVVAIYYAPGGGIGVHAEPIAVAYIVFAMFLVAYGLYRARTPRTRMVFLVLGGVFVAVGGLAKQTLAISSVPMLIWVLLHGSTKVAETFADGRARWLPVLKSWGLPFVAGGLGLVAVVLLRYALAGELGTFFYWSAGVGAQVYMAAYKGRVAELLVEWFLGEPWAILGVLLSLTIAFGPALGRATGFSPRGLIEGLGHSAFEIAVGLMGVVVMIGAALPHRIWPHYFLPVWPFFGLVVGILIERLAVRGMARPRAAQGVVVVLCAALLVITGVRDLSHIAQMRATGGMRDPSLNPVCKEIDRIAGKGREEIFIWGIAGDLYVSCRRRSASMFTHAMVLLGIMPPSWEPRPDLVPPGTREKLLAELKARPPKLIIDHYVSGPGSAMVDIPMYGTFVNERYCRLSSTGTNRDGAALTFFARKDLPACRS